MVQKAIIQILTLVLVLSASSLIGIQTVKANIMPVENSRATKAPLNVARSGLGVAAVNGKIYAIGGITVPSVLDVNAISGLPVSSEPQLVGTNEEYDPSTNTWSFKTQMPIPRADFATAVFQNKIYCIGGVTDSATVSVNEVYDPENDNWVTKASMPASEEGLQADVLNGKIYVMGGSSNYVYNPTTDNWTTMPPLPNILSGLLSSCVLDNEIYVVSSQSTQIFNPENNSWTIGSQPPASMAQPIAVATSGIEAPARIYVFDESSLEVYDPQTNSWIVGSTLPTVLTNPGPDVGRVVSDHESYGVVVLNDIIYVIGGETVTVSTEYVNSTFYPENVSELAMNLKYIPFGYGTIPPEISIVFPTNETSSSNNILLNFVINKPVSWIGYSLDGQQNVTLTGNSTIANMPNGLHSITVYANDTYGNFGASKTIAFTVETPGIETSSTIEVFATIAVSIAVVCVVASLLIYRKKCKRLIL